MTETVLIASYVEPELVARVRSAWDGDVLYEPSLLPAPRYAADHNGTRPALDPAAETRWRELLGRAEISFDFDWWQPDRMPDNCPKLRWVQATSAGIGGFVRRHGLDRGDIVFTTAAGAHAVPLAEFALTGALYLVKGVPDLLDRQRRHHWQRYTTRSLAGRRVTVVGLGHIGRHVAEVFAALGTRVVGVARPGGSHPHLPGVTVTEDVDRALPDTDVLVLATPLTDDTRHLIDRRRLGLLPAGAVLVNVARGPVVDQQALVAALSAGRLGGAALDVTDPEPLPADSPLWDMPNVLLSPHSAATLATENEALVELFVDNLTRWRTGRPLRNRYRDDLGY